MSRYRRPRDWRAAIARRKRRDTTERHEEPLRRKERRPTPHHLRHLGDRRSALRYCGGWE